MNILNALGYSHAKRTTIVEIPDEWMHKFDQLVRLTAPPTELGEMPDDRYAFVFIGQLVDALQGMAEQEGERPFHFAHHPLTDKTVWVATGKFPPDNTLAAETVTEQDLDTPQDEQPRRGYEFL